MHLVNLNQYLDSSNNIIIALSGGADSVCLTHLLWKEEKYKIVLAHFNHQLRGKESDADESFCNKFAKKLGLEIEVEKWGKPKKSEAKARDARYRFLRKIQKKHQAQVIVLGHHLDDQTETIVFNFLRGTGVRGLRGMAILENELLRPLLKDSKKDILDYCKKNKLKYCTDKTNFDETYTRNFLRLKVLPDLEKVNPSLGKTLSMNAQNYREISDYFAEQAQPFVVQKTLKLKEFLSFPKALQTEILRQKLDGVTEPSFKKIEEIMRIIQGGKGNKFKQFGDLKVSVNGGVISFES